MNYYGMINKEITRDKYIFWDIDGTLGAFRYNDHVAAPDGSHNGMSLEEIEEGCFYFREPSKWMKKVLAECGARQQFILGHCHADKEITDKKRWVAEQLPEIDEVFLVADEVPKYEVVLQVCQERGIDLAQVLLVDDTIGIIIEAERHGVPSYHISSFLDWDYQ